jgi:hypothetical protein
MEMPAQPLLGAAALVDQIVAVIDQQLELPVDPLVRPGPAQARLPERGTGDRERVDRVRLAARAAGARCGAVKRGGTRKSRSPAADSVCSIARVT